MKKLLILLTLTALSTLAHSQKLDLLQNIAKTVNIEELCKRPYTPYPNYTDRNYWQSLPEVVKAQAVQDGEKALDYVWRSVTITSYLDYQRTGQRQPNDLHIGERHDKLGALVLAELIEGKGRFIDQIANGVWSLCEQSTWVATAHISNQRSGTLPDIHRRAIDLSSGETASALSWAYYFFGEELSKLSPQITARLTEELDNHIMSVFLKRDDLWWKATKDGAFVNNWNPWCNFNVLLTALLIEKDPKRKEQILRETMRSVDQFINYYKNDGGCEEGPSYWDHAGGKMMEYLSLLKRFSSGTINAFTNERVQNMGRYIAKAHIDSLYFVNFADAEARVKPIPTTIYRYGKEIQDKGLMQFGSYVARIANFEKSPLSGALDMKLSQTELYNEMCSTEALAPLYSKVWLPGIELALARTTKGTPSGFTFAAKGGFNDESHNHNDVGSFLLYLDGEPFIVDAGVGTYTAKTFSSERYSIWTMQSEYHNLPLINGMGQKFGKEYRSSEVKYKDDDRVMTFEMELCNAYPVQAHCKSWIRGYQFDRRARQVTISDRYELTKWSAPSAINLMVNAEIQTDNGIVILQRGDKKIKLAYDPRKMEFTQQKVSIDDPRLTKIWSNSLTRITLTIKDQSPKGRHSVTISY